MLAKVLMCLAFLKVFRKKEIVIKKKKKKKKKNPFFVKEKKKMYLFCCKCKDDHDFLVHACKYHPFIGKGTKLND